MPTEYRRSWWVLIGEVLREPMLLLLLASGGIYLLLGDQAEAVLLLASAGLVIGLALYQERRTERALTALRDLASPRALVVRNGQAQRIPGREVVRGDLMVLAEGDRVPADAAVVQAAHLWADESLLTGESVPVRKRLWDGRVSMARPGGEDQPFVYAGTLISKGHGWARVLATGLHTEMGAIGRSLQTLVPEATHLQQETRRLVRILAVAGISLCVLVAVVYTLTRADLLDGILAGLTLAMAMVPEEFPVVLSIFLALGAWRIAQQHVLTRQAAAIEMLGAATVLCVDKTGTLTQNRMAVRQLAAGDNLYVVPAEPGGDLPDAYHTLLEYAVLASQRAPFDPMEQAIHALATRYLTGTEHVHQTWTLVREYPLSETLLALAHVWCAPDDTRFIIAAKGAPEAVADLCHLDPAARAALRATYPQAQIYTFAGGGHIPGITRQMEYLAVIRSFLAGQSLAAAPATAAPKPEAVAAPAGVKTPATARAYYLARRPHLLKAFDKTIKQARPVLAEQLGYDAATLTSLIADVRAEYARLIPELPYIGGQQNRLSWNLEESALFLALYRALHRRGKDPAEVGQLVYALTVYWYNRYPRWLARLIGRSRFSRWYTGRLQQWAARSQRRRYPGDFVYQYIPGDGKTFDFGVDYTACAICRFYHAQGADEFMPYLCPLDYAISAAFGLGMVRMTTLAEGGPRCDFRFLRGRPTRLRWPVCPVAALALPEESAVNMAPPVDTGAGMGR